MCRTMCLDLSEYVPGTVVSLCKECDSPSESPVGWGWKLEWKTCIELRARQAGRNVGRAEVRVPESVHGRGWAVREHQEI